MKKLNEAESKFFESKGEDVHETLSTPPATTEPPPEGEASAQASAPASTATPPAADAAPAAKPEAQPQRQQVPLEALHAERQKRQQSEAALAELQRAIAEAQRQQPEQPPSMEEDPVAALAYQNRQLQQQLADFNNWKQQQEAAQSQRAAYSQFTQHVVASEQAFQAEHADYQDAAQFALQQYDRMLQASFPDPAQRQAQLQYVAATELARVVQSGGNPAEFVYRFAQQMGYQQQQAAPTIPAAPPVQTVPEAVRKIEKGMRQQANLSGGGATPPSEMTPEMLSNIKDPKAFNDAWKRAFG